MSKIQIITIGRLKNKSIKTEVEELLKRIPRIEIIELKESKNKNVEQIKQEEYKTIKPNLKSENFNIVLTEKGNGFTTNELTDKLNKIQTQAIAFIISGPYGPSSELLKESNLNLSLSKMTYTHEQALYMLVEQLYRRETINRGISYNK